MSKNWEVLAKLFSLLPSLLPLLEKHWSLLPVNPAVRSDVWVLSIIISAVAGFGGYQSSGRYHFLGWTGLFLFVVTLSGELAITATEIGFGLAPRVLSLLARIGYVLLFLFLGLAIGGFLRLYRSS